MEKCFDRRFAVALLTLAAALGGACMACAAAVGEVYFIQPQSIHLLRSRSDPGSKLPTPLGRGTRVRALSVKGRWVKVRGRGQKGWINVFHLSRNKIEKEHDTAKGGWSVNFASTAGARGLLEALPKQMRSEGAVSRKACELMDEIDEWKFEPPAEWLDKVMQKGKLGPYAKGGAE